MVREVKGEEMMCMLVADGGARERGGRRVEVNEHLHLNIQRLFVIFMARAAALRVNLNLQPSCLRAGAARVSKIIRVRVPYRC